MYDRPEKNFCTQTEAAMGAVGSPTPVEIPRAHQPKHHELQESIQNLAAAIDSVANLESDLKGEPTKAEIRGDVDYRCFVDVLNSAPTDIYTLSDTLRRITSDLRTLLL